MNLWTAGRVTLGLEIRPFEIETRLMARKTSDGSEAALDSALDAGTSIERYYAYDRSVQPPCMFSCSSKATRAPS